MLWQFIFFFFGILVLRSINKQICKIESPDHFLIIRGVSLLSFILFSTIVYSYNYENIGILIFVFGGALNLLVMTVNRGLMPVDINATKRCFRLSSDKEATDKINEIYARTRIHKVSDESTRLRILIDRFDYNSCINSLGDAAVECGIILISIQLTYSLITEVAVTLFRFLFK